MQRDRKYEKIEEIRVFRDIEDRRTFIPYICESSQKEHIDYGKSDS